VHLVCDKAGTVLAVLATAGQRHDCRAFGPVMAHARRPRHDGRPRWPKAAAGDKGYTYPPVRDWLRRHHIGAVIPTRSNQRPEPNFDKASYRKRNIIERVVGWYKECRALGTRSDKLAVNYVALWVVANLHRLLKKRLRFLKNGFSETT
jgi:transposase